MIFNVDEIESPIGLIRFAVRDGHLCALGFIDHWLWRLESLHQHATAPEFHAAADPAGIATRMRAYFAGDLQALDAIDVAPQGTPFQLRVWAALRTIPAGQTTSYGELARSIGSPPAVRAVGAANGANPIGIVVPCHRVIGANGRLVGYGGGLERKQWLLNHEGAYNGLSGDLFAPPSSARGE